MEQVDPRELRQRFAALAAAQSKWEANPAEGSTDFHAVLNETKREIAAWAEEGRYLGGDVQRLRGEVEVREAFIRQVGQQRERGY